MCYNSCRCKHFYNHVHIINEMSQHNYCSGQKSVQNVEHDEQNGSEDFDLGLLEQVKKYSCIYSKANKKKNKDKIETAWLTIASDLEKSVEDCQNRFTRLRQYYAKERTKRKQGSSTNSFRLYENCTFLEPFIYTRTVSKTKSPAVLKPHSNKYEEVEESIAEVVEAPFDKTLPSTSNTKENYDLLDLDVVSIASSPTREEENDQRLSPTGEEDNNQRSFIQETVDILDKDQVSISRRSNEDQGKVNNCTQRNYNHGKDAKQKEVIASFRKDNESVRNIIFHHLQSINCAQKKNKFIMEVMKILFE